MIVMKLFLICNLFIVHCRTADVYHIGALFDDSDTNKELGFVAAINQYTANDFYQFEPLISTINVEEPFEALTATCSLLEGGLVAIFGPSGIHNAEAVQSICDTKEIPLIETSWSLQDERNLFLLNLYPHPHILAQMYVDIVNAWGWKEFTILYETTESLIRISQLLEMHNQSGYTVVVRQLDRTFTQNYRPTLKDALQSDETHFLLDCMLTNLDEILKQAQQVGLISSKYHFIITNLDMQTIDLSPYQFGDANITGLSMVDFSNDHVMAMSEEIEKLGQQNGATDEWKMHLETALIIDAVQLFNRAVKDARFMNNFAQYPLNCSLDDNWEFGYSLINFMRMDTMEGLTGLIKFNHEGVRSDFEISLMELTENGLTTIGSWNVSDGFRIAPRAFEETDERDETTLRNKTFRVMTALTAPYAMLRKSPSQLSGNEQFEGFGIDLIAELAAMEGFNYVFMLRKDKANGRYDPKLGRWTGMIGDVMLGIADLAITDLTITSVREDAVDFTEPFMTLGISILYRKAEKAPPSFFSFAAPFSNGVWLVLGGAALCVSIALYITGRLSPEEWTNPYPCIEEPTFLVNQFSFRNSIWFMVGSLMQQGSEIAPIAIATRMIAGLWWFFALIMVSSYTANLASFLTTDSPEVHFTNIKELVERADKYGIRYGAKDGGATSDFFKDGAKNNSIYKTVWEYMKSHPKDMVSDNTDGVLRADEGRYAFFMESTSIEYETQRHCNLTQVGGKLDEKRYGIAMRKNSTYRRTLNTALLKLASQGTIDKLKRRWWEEKGEHCSSEEAAEGAPPLDFKNVSGIFWVTIGGSIFAFLMVMVEFTLHSFKLAASKKISFKEQLKEEVQFFVKFEENVKPVKRKSSTSSSKKSQLTEADENHVRASHSSN